VILTVTLNAALDVTYRVDRLRPHETHRVTEVTTRAGGKGVNAAGILLQLHEPAVATGFAGGETGDRIHAGLTAAHLPDAFVPITANSRRTVTVVEGDGAGATGFWEPGPVVTAAEWGAFQDRYRGLLKVARAVVLSGSLPAGIPTDAYAHLTTVAHDLEVPVVLDADGPALTAAVPAGPTLIKPNLDELRHALPDAAVDLGDPAGAGLAAVIAAGRRLRERGAGAVVVSLGADGMVALTEDGTVLRAAPPAPVAGNPTGAGDAAVAALARGLAHRTPWPRRLAEAVAASAAAVAAPVAGRLEMRLYDRLRREIAVHDITSEHPAVEAGPEPGTDGPTGQGGD
jgi:tagatose 6-phosphate kinase